MRWWARPSPSGKNRTPLQPVLGLIYTMQRAGIQPQTGSTMGSRFIDSLLLPQAQ